VVILYSEIIAWSFPFYECNEHSPFYFQPAKHAKYTKGLFSKKFLPARSLGVKICDRLLQVTSVRQ